MTVATLPAPVYPWQLPMPIVACADDMGVEILACAKDRHGRFCVVAYRGTTLAQPYVCWGWDGRNFDGGVYTCDEAGALASLRARREA
jgi:hypothetical protein